MLVLLLACTAGGADSGAGLPLTLRFTHVVDGAPAEVGTTPHYTDPSGNGWALSRLSWVVAQPSLTTAEGDRWTLDQGWVVDLADPDTHAWTVQVDPEVVLDHHCICLDLRLGAPAGIPVPDAPADMAWPESLGGGLHHLRLEGTHAQGSFALHAGPLDGADTTVAVTLDLDALTLSEAGTEVRITADLARWLTDPHDIDLTTVPSGGIMDRADWQAVLQDNGHDVLAVEAAGR